MRSNFRFYVLGVLLCYCACFGSYKDPVLSDSSAHNYFINNKVLFAHGDKVVTALDVINKLNILYYQNYPTMLESKATKAQFYSGAWSVIAKTVVDDFLISLEADTRKVAVSNSEVKQELERLFGVDSFNTLSKLDMSFSDAFNVIERDLIVQRMLGMMVRSKVMMSVTPKMVIDEYAKEKESFVSTVVRKYSILNISANLSLFASNASSKIQSHINNIGFDKEDLLRIANECNCKLSFSEEYVRSEHDISSIHKEYLTGLNPMEASNPIKTKEGFRLFFVSDVFDTQPPSFASREIDIKHKILGELIAAADAEYKDNLRALYGLNQDLDAICMLDEKEHVLAWLQ